MSAPEEAVRIEVLDATSPRKADVLALYRSDSGTLGFFPIGAFDEKIEAGRLLVAVQGEETIAYLLYSMTRKDAVIVHLCVSKGHRGGRVPDELFKRLRGELHDRWPIRLTCRKDYDAAERIWRRLGFEIISTRRGRGADRAELRVWRWEPSDQERPLLKYIQDRHVDDRIQAVIDANVFFDLIDPASATNEESKVLTQDWLDDLVAFMRTPELNNEIYRSEDGDRRRAALAAQSGYPEVRSTPDQVESSYQALSECLPEPGGEQDRSDRRHLAHAIAAQTPYFITRDKGILAYAEDIRRRFNIQVLNPLDFFLALDEDVNPGAYQPSRLAATRLQVRRVTAVEREDIAIEFQRYPQAEPKAQWHGLLARTLGAEDAIIKTVVGPGGERLLVFGTRRRAPHALDISLLRMKGSTVALTAARHVLMSVLVHARKERLHAVTCSDTGPPQVHEALSDAGFSALADGTWSRALIDDTLVRAEVDARIAADPLLRDLATTNPAGATAIDLERKFWPLKVVGEGVPCFIVPIQPCYAHQLFDHELSGELFPPPTELACALENIFYSGSDQRALRGFRGRILWYVSKQANDPLAMRVRACSIVEEGAHAPAREQFKRYRRLGAYHWSQVSNIVKGDPNKPLTTIRFSHTELFPKPVDWKSLQSILMKNRGKGNQMQGPLRLSEQEFFDIYRQGMARAAAV